eukprot:807037-Amphidinium_carterae.3
MVTTTKKTRHLAQAVRVDDARSEEKSQSAIEGNEVYSNYGSTSTSFKGRGKSLSGCGNGRRRPSMASAASELTTRRVIQQLTGHVTITSSTRLQDKHFNYLLSMTATRRAQDPSLR